MVKVEGLSFAYNRAAGDVLHDINFEALAVLSLEIYVVQHVACGSIVSKAQALDFNHRSFLP